MSYIPDLFARARDAATVEMVAGVKLYREGDGWRGECPLCGASKNRTNGGAFWANTSQTLWMCFACSDEQPEDVIELEHRLRGEAGLTPGEAARAAAMRIIGAVEGDQSAKARRESVRTETDNAGDNERRRQARARIAIRLWKEARPAKGTLVETYLRTIGFWGWHLEQALEQVRFHPRAYHSGDSKNPINAPAMIGLIMTPFGPTGGVHVTYLSKDGTSKSDLDPARKRWGAGVRSSEQGRQIAGGVWLTSPKIKGPLVVGEGIETTLAAAILLRVPCRIVATLDLRGLQGNLLKGPERTVDLTGPTTDPMRPAFTWPNIERAILCIDRDMAPMTFRTGVNEQITLDAAGRASLCARMAHAAWRNVGTDLVQFAIPPEGMDMRDQLVKSPLSRLTLKELPAFV